MICKKIENVKIWRNIASYYTVNSIVSYKR